MNEKGNLNEYDDLNSIDVCVFPISKSKLDPISKSSSNLDPNPNEEDIVMDVEDLLQLALEERKGKQEAKLVIFFHRGTNKKVLNRNLVNLVTCM